MRYSSALVLSTVAIGSAAAANVRHANFHARRSADKAVAWGDVAYDLSKVDWSKVDWSSVFNSEAQPTPTPAPVEPKVKVEEVKTSEAPAPTPTPEAKPSPAEEQKPKQTAAVKKVSEVVGDIFAGMEDFVKSKGISGSGVNAKDSSANIYLGPGQWTAEFSNGGGSDIKLFCWEAKGFSGMSLNVQNPAIAINLAPGASQNVSFAANVPSSCAPMTADTVLGYFGGVENTWWEVTMGPQGAFDVSRNVWMHGTSIHSQGSKCTSDMNTCVFKCQDESAKSCEKGYDLYNCNADNGGGGGFDPVMGGTGGGCAMGSDGEFVRVTLG